MAMVQDVVTVWTEDGAQTVNLSEAVLLSTWYDARCVMRLLDGTLIENRAGRWCVTTELPVAPALVRRKVFRYDPKKNVSRA